MKLKVGLMLAGGFLFYVLADILIWQRIFEQHALYSVGIGVYHLGYAMVLIGLILVGSVALLPKWKYSLVYAATFLILAMSGMEDILYYWLDGRLIPSVLPWLNTAPLVLFKPVTSFNLILSASFWLTVCIVLLLFQKE
ncbi:MAG TPA: hypothetical protein VF941_07400 [Clostridia bacterium]